MAKLLQIDFPFDGPFGAEMATALDAIVGRASTPTSSWSASNTHALKTRCQEDADAPRYPRR